MSTLPENELDLEKLFLPAWAQTPASQKSYADYEVREERQDRRGDRRDRRPGQPGQRPGGGGRPQGDRARQGGFGGGPRGDRRGGPRPGGDRRGPKSEQQRGPGPRRDERRDRPEPLPLPELNLAFLPDDAGVDSLARQIKMTGRAYPLFDIARLILQKPERHMVSFSVKKKDNQVVQPLFVCALDDTLWLSEDAAIGHVLNKHFGTFYQTERTPTEPPKGKYTFVAQCGMSGVILGPPNYHDYQNQLRKLHAERFARMPFEMFKSRVKIVRDEEVIKKWTEDQSFKTEFVCLNVPEATRLSSRDAVEKHFRETHKEAIIKQVESHTMSGSAARNLRAPELVRLVRQGWEDQRRFPLQLATNLSQRFASYGLQFFKVNKAITHVSVARPHYLDLETTPVSEGVKRIVDFINATPKCTRRKLLETLVPTPKAAPTPPPAPAEAAPEGVEQPASTPAPAPSAAAEPTAEQTAVISDLHWLIHQGHVIEFANGIMETAKKPLPKPEKKPAAAQAAAPAAATVAAESSPAATGSAEPAIVEPQVPDLSGDAPLEEASQPAAESQPPAEASESTVVDVPAAGTPEDPAGGNPTQ